MIISVIGLGYVGLPLAAAFARYFDVVGYDKSRNRIAEINNGYDRTGELAACEISRALERLNAVDTPAAIADVDIHIVTVPTPVDQTKQPNLKPIISACKTVGAHLKIGSIVVFESTVYPGVTEDICGPKLEDVSGLKCGTDFFLGYSPERINPGDKVHTIDNIVKVVAGQTSEVTEKLVNLYSSVIAAGIHVAPSIKVAEAAKVIENAQRDINIAFVNEVAIICQKLGVSVHDVLEAAQTKWNFLSFMPGLVGGHCIGVDPYYMAYCAEQLGHRPDIILAGRHLNDRMGGFVAEQIGAQLAPHGRILVLGLTFKEDVSDLRNTKAIDVIRCLTELGFAVDVHDHLADAREAKMFFDIDLVSDIFLAYPYDAVVGLVPHAKYRGWLSDDLRRLTLKNGLIADVKGIWRAISLAGTRRYWTL